MKTKINSSLIIIIIILINLICIDFSFSNQYTWDGSTSTAWNDSTNWTKVGAWTVNGFPSTNDTVTISNNPYHPVLDTIRTVKRLTMTSDTLDLNSKILTVSTRSDFNGGLISNGTIQPQGTQAIYAGTTFTAAVYAVTSYNQLNGSTFSSSAYFDNTSNVSTTGSGNNTFNGVTTIIKSGTGSGTYTIAGTTGNTFNDSLIVSNKGTAAIVLSTAGSSSYNGHITVSCTASGGISFGSTSGGTSTLASGKTIRIGTDGFSAGTLLLRDFTQTGSTAQSFTLTTSGTILNLINATFNGTVDFTSPLILLKQNTFNAAATFTKTGASCQSYGGNTFNSTANLYTSGTGAMQLAENTGDAFNGDLNFYATSEIHPLEFYTSTLKGNLYMQGIVAFDAGNGANATLEFTGTQAQSVSANGVKNFKCITINKSSNNVTLDTTINVQALVTFVKGKIISTPAHLFKFGNGSTVSGASDSSFISGPVRKTGISAFVFPVGKNNSYRAIEMSAPSNLNTSDAFTAEYFDTGQTLGTSSDAAIKYISQCNYWNLSRFNGTSTVTVKLNWDSTACGLTDSSYVLVANWNGSTWKDLGNGGITGSRYLGKVVNSTGVITYGNFALAYNHCFLTANAGIDKSTCLGDSATVGASPVAAMGTASYTYSWNPSSGLSGSSVANPKGSPSSTTDYVVIVTDAKSCSATDTVKVTPHPITYTWTGTTSTAWATSANWSPAGVPGSCDNVIIVTGSNNVYLSAEVTVNSFTINSGTVNLQTYTLNIEGTGSSYFNSGTINNGILIMEHADTTAFNGTTFGAALVISTDKIFLNGSTFDFAELYQTGNTNTVSAGGNTFNGDFSLENTGNGTIYLANSNADVFNDGVYFGNYGSGTICPAYTKNTTYTKDVYAAPGSKIMSFGANGGKVIFSGSATQNIGSSAAASADTLLSFKKVQINKSAGYLKLNFPVRITDSLSLTKGNITSDTTNMLIMNAGSVVTGASDSSFVNGPMKKFGNTAFIFATGKGSRYRSAEISAPSNTTDAFTAEYFNTEQSSGTSMESSLKYLNKCNYWKLLRNSGSSNVTVKLSWDSTSCSLLDSASLKIANWNGSTWKDLGNGGVTGNHYVGKVINSTTVYTYGNFALAYNHCFLTADAGTDQSLCASDDPADVGGSPVAAMGTGAFTYSWSPSAGLTSTTVSNPQASPDVTTDYTVTVTDAAGCTKTDVVNVQFNPVNFSTEGTDLLWGNAYPKGNESIGYSIQQTNDSGFVVCGSVLNSSNNLDVYLIKLNIDGDTTWTKTIGVGYDDVGYSVKQCRDSGYIITGYTYKPSTSTNDFHLIKTNKDGDTTWVKTKSGSLNAKSYSVVQALDGGYLTVGYIDNGGSGALDMQAVKFNSSGTIVWSKDYGGTDDEVAYSVGMLPDSGFIICGSTKSFSADEDVYVVRTDKNGDTLWTRYYEQDGAQTANALYVCEESGFVVTGKTETDDNGDDMLLMKIYDDGTLLWTKTYGGEDDEVAYDVKETKNYGFELAGSSTSFEDKGKDIYLVTTDDFGELIEEKNYGSEMDDEARAVSVTEDNDMVFAGRMGSVCNAPLLWDGWAIPPCGAPMPRGIWFGQSWNFDSNKSGQKAKTMLINTDAFNTENWDVKMSRFIAYCQNARIHTVVLNNLEDILRIENTCCGTFSNFPAYTSACSCYPDSHNFDHLSGDTLRNRLSRLVSNLHLASVSTVLAQWLDQDSLQYNVAVGTCSGVTACDFSTNYHSDETNKRITDSEEILDALIDFNTNVNLTIFPGGRFDGLLLDYEYFSPYYGSSTTDYEHSAEGAHLWMTLIDEFNAAKDPVVNGIKKVQAYMNYICFTDPTIESTNRFDYNGVGGTTDDDTYEEIADIDSKNLDAIVLAFPVRDKLYGNITPDNNDYPNYFLKGIPNGGAVSINQLMRYRLEIFGHNSSNVSTNIIPWFRSVNALTCGVDQSWLGDYYLGNCAWTASGEHFLADAETEFIYQFQHSSLDIDYPTWDKESNYGDVRIYKGFQGFQYGLNDPNLVATTYDATHSLRVGDALRSYWCNNTLRSINNNSNNHLIPSGANKKMESLAIYPNPFNAEAFIIVEGNFNNQANKIKVIDVLGKDVTSYFSFEKSNIDNQIIIRNKTTVSGIYSIIISDNNSNKISGKFVVIH